MFFEMSYRTFLNSRELRPALKNSCSLPIAHSIPKEVSRGHIPENTSTDRPKCITPILQERQLSSLDFAEGRRVFPADKSGIYLIPAPHHCTTLAANSAQGEPRIRGQLFLVKNPMKRSAGLAIESIKHILELSADAQIRRRAAAEGSPDFHRLTGAIAAFGNVLAFLALHESPKPSIHREASVPVESCGCRTRVEDARGVLLRFVREL
jgi:hypothetical protein